MTSEPTQPDDSAPGDPRRAATGDARVDSVLERLDELADLPVTEHAVVYEAIHARLREVLSGLDDVDEGPT